MFIIISGAICNPMWCQHPVEDALELLDNLPDESIEQLQEHTGIFEDLQYLIDNPLDLNTVSARDLELLYMLTPGEIEAFIAYRDTNGPIIHPYELQVVDDLPLDKIQQLIPFVTVGDESTDNREGKGYLMVRSSGYLPKRRGFRSENDDAPAYQAGPMSLLIKFRQYQSRNYSWGGSMELDSGERFSFNNKAGFDHIHLHYYKTGRPGRIKTLALGDYRISLGQGLILYQGFAVTKPSNPLIIKRVSPVIMPYTGTSEYYYFRGAALEIETHPDLQNYIFIHRKKRDATIRSYSDENHYYFSAFQTNGFHRSITEEQKRSQVAETIAGHRIQWGKGLTKVGFNSLFQHFSIPYQPVSRIDNLHRLTGSTQLSHSLDYSGYLGSLHYFGEVATQNYRTPAFSIAGLYSFHSKLDGGLLIRRFPAYFAPVYGNAFSARSIPNNESGVYLGLNYHFGPYSRLSLYVDSWKGLWPTFLAQGPTFDQDIFIKYEISSRRKWEAYGQVKFKHRADNQPHLFPDYRTITYNNQINMRLQFRKIQYQKWRWTNRLEVVRIKPGEAPAEFGIMGFTDLMWSPIGKSLSFATRLAYFTTKSYDSRIYSYEPDILYSFSIPSFYGRGWRIAARASFQWRSGLRMELRTGWTIQPGEEEIGSGLNAIPGPFSQQLKMQVMYRF